MKKIRKTRCPSTTHNSKAYAGESQGERFVPLSEVFWHLMLFPNSIFRFRLVRASSTVLNFVLVILCSGGTLLCSVPPPETATIGTPARAVSTFREFATNSPVVRTNSGKIGTRTDEWHNWSRKRWAGTSSKTKT